MNSITLPMILGILPEILILALWLILLLFDALWGEERRRTLGWIAAFGLIAIAGITLIAARPAAQSTLLWGGMIRHDWMGFTFTILFLFGAAITCLFAMDMPQIGRRGEFYLLLLASTLHVSDGFRRRFDHALSCHRNHFYPALRPGWLPQDRCKIHRVRFQVFSLRRVDLDDHALWFQPAVRI